MTREEAIRIFRKEIECLSHTKCEDCILEKACDPMNTTPYDSEYIEAYSMAIKALEREPTTKNNLGVDCISRQAVLNLPRKQLKNYFGEVTGEVIDVKDIMDMPSVTPKIEPRKGHWIIVEELHGEWEGTKKYACNKCGEKVGVFKSNYCPNCGADMREVENE